MLIIFAFGFQGNSNSIVTVDVSAGYVGIVDFFPPAIGVLMTLAVYSAPTLWHFGLLVALNQLAGENTR